MNLFILCFHLFYGFINLFKCIKKQDNIYFQIFPFIEKKNIQQNETKEKKISTLSQKILYGENIFKHNI